MGKLEWTQKQPNRAGYYWYLGPVLSRDFKRVKNGVDIRECTWGPIIAGVGICLKEIPSGDGHIPHEKMWQDGRIVVEFYGSTVRRTLSEIPYGAMWSNAPITPPYNYWSWHLQPERKRASTPFTAEINASEMSAWSEACKKAEKHFSQESAVSAVEKLLQAALEGIPIDFGAAKEGK